MVLPNGQLRWIGGRGHVECNGDGQPVRMRGASLDITKRKQAEDQFRLVVEAAPSAMIMVNTEGCHHVGQHEGRGRFRLRPRGTHWAAHRDACS